MLRTPRKMLGWNSNENQEDWELIAAAGALAAVVAALSIALNSNFVGIEDLAGPAGSEIVWKLWSR
jgi:hypothetical protein